MSNNNRIPSYDGMRLIASFLVVSLHTPSIFPSQISAIIADIARIAVPYFLLLSGYNIYDKNSSIEDKRIINSIKKILSILIVSIICYAIFDYLVFEDFERLKISLYGFTSYKFFIFNTVPFCPIGWYLLSYIYILIITYFVKKTIFQFMFMFISIILSLITGVYSKVLGLEINSLLWNCSFICTFGFFSLGYIIRKHKNKISLLKYSNKSLLFIILISIFLTVLEHISINKITSQSVNGTIFLSSYPCVIAIFIYLTKNPTVLSSLQNFGKKYSLNIYIYHVALHYALVKIFCPDIFGLKSSELILIPHNIVPLIINNFTIFIILLLILISIEKLKYKKDAI